MNVPTHHQVPLDWLMDDGWDGWSVRWMVECSIIKEIEGFPRRMGKEG